jgi:hypothetical protein
VGAVTGGITNTVANHRHIDSFWAGAGYFGVGAVAGAAGAYAGGAVAGAVAVGGFAGGAVSGAAGGAASGFVAGSGNAWMGGAGFGQGLQSGLIGGGIGAAVGGLGGGLLRGISDYRHGYSFWDGSKVDEFVVGNYVTREDFARTAKMYNESNLAEWNDMLLQDRMQDEFGVSKGDFNINKITTKTGDDYGLGESGYYIELKTNKIVGGYALRYTTGYTSIHVSPHYALGNIVDFRAVAGHELIHAYHYYTLPKTVHLYTERVAHQYTYSVYMNSGRIATAMSQLGSMLFNAYTGSYPAQYSIPSIFRFSF